MTEFENFKQQLQENQKNLEISLSTQPKLEEIEAKIEDEETIIEEYLDPEFVDEEVQPQSKDTSNKNLNLQVCPICGKNFSSGSLDTHIKRIHSEGYNFFCDQCPLKFKVKRDLISHLTKHTEVELRRKFQCEYCENSYTKNSSLQHHIKMRHEDVKEQFLCECGASFKTKLRLNYHKVRF